MRSTFFVRKNWEVSVRSGKYRRRFGACLIAAGLLFASFEGVRHISDRRVRDAYVGTPTKYVSDHFSLKLVASGIVILSGIALVITSER